MRDPCEFFKNENFKGIKSTFKSIKSTFGVKHLLVLQLTNLCEFLITCRLLRRKKTWGSRPEKSQGKEKKRLRRTAIGSTYDIEFEWTKKKSIKCDSSDKIRTFLDSPSACVRRSITEIHSRKVSVETFICAPQQIYVFSSQLVCKVSR